MAYTIDQLQLGPLAHRAAQDLITQFGPSTIWFTRGYSNLTGQALAMAGNVARNKEWIKQTYTHRDRPSFAVACALQEAVYRHIEVESKGKIAEYLLACLESLPNGGDISFHTKLLDGKPAAEAFDLLPLEDRNGVRSPIGDQVVQFIDEHKEKWQLDQFLQREGGLRVWHCQFLAREPDPVTPKETPRG